MKNWDHRKFKKGTFNRFKVHEKSIQNERTLTNHTNSVTKMMRCKKYDSVGVDFHTFFRKLFPIENYDRMMFKEQLFYHLLYLYGKNMIDQ